jgi:hypothetical protein
VRPTPEGPAAMRDQDYLPQPRAGRRRGVADMDHCRERSYPEPSHITEPGIMLLTDLPREGDFRT